MSLFDELMRQGALREAARAVVDPATAAAAASSPEDRAPTLEGLPERPARGWFSQQVTDPTIPPGQSLMVVLEAVRPSVIEWLRVLDETGLGEISFGMILAPRPAGLNHVQALPLGALAPESRVLEGTAAATPLHRLRNGVDYDTPEWYVPAGQSLWICSTAGAERIDVELQWREVAP